jgi:hypothetical protein
MIDENGFLIADPAELAAGEMVSVPQVIEWMADLPPGMLANARSREDLGRQTTMVREAGLLLSESLPKLDLRTRFPAIAATAAFADPPTKGYRLSLITGELFEIPSAARTGSIELFNERKEHRKQLVPELMLPRKGVVEVLLSQPLNQKRQWIARFLAAHSWRPDELISVLDSGFDFDRAFCLREASDELGLARIASREYERHLHRLTEKLRSGELHALSRRSAFARYDEIPAYFWMENDLHIEQSGKLYSIDPLSATARNEINGFTLESIRSAFPEIENAIGTCCYSADGLNGCRNNGAATFQTIRPKNIKSHGRKPTLRKAAREAIVELMREGQILDTTTDAAAHALVNERLRRKGDSTCSEDTVRRARGRR